MNGGKEEDNFRVEWIVLEVSGQLDCFPQYLHENTGIAS
jgi:hypothetical protein